MKLIFVTLAVLLLPISVSAMDNTAQINILLQLVQKLEQQIIALDTQASSTTATATPALTGFALTLSRVQEFHDIVATSTNSNGSVCTRLWDTMEIDGIRRNAGTVVAEQNCPKS